MNHKTRASKNCTYHDFKSATDLEKAVQKRLRILYPEEYDESDIVEDEKSIEEAK